MFLKINFVKEAKGKMIKACYSIKHLTMMCLAKKKIKGNRRRVWKFQYNQKEMCVKC